MSDHTNYKAEDLLLDDSFIQYCEGEPEATIYWNKMKATHPELSPEMEKARSMYMLLSVKIDKQQIDEELDRLKSSIEAAKTEDGLAPVYTMTTTPKWRKALLAVAVAASVILAVTYFYSNYSSPAINNVKAVDFAKATYEQVIHSDDDERRKVELPDGSEATLNYGSTIKIASDYNKNQRWIYLEGEAFFSVKPDKSKPFVVITSKNATSALGTSFKVRDYPNESVSDVMLATGKVKVQSMKANSSKSDLVLMPGEKATCKNDGLPTRSAFKLDVLNNWRALKIELDQANLDEIIATLQFNYGIQVKLQNKPLKEFAFTGKFNNESLHDVLEAISFTNKFSYTQNGNIVSVLFQ